MLSAIGNLGASLPRFSTPRQELGCISPGVASTGDKFSTCQSEVQLRHIVGAYTVACLIKGVV